MRDMYEVMDRWGAWAASDNSGVDWQPIAAGFKGTFTSWQKSRIQCDDDEGIMIDSCVARLRRYKPEEYENHHRPLCYRYLITHYCEEEKML